MLITDLHAEVAQSVPEAPSLLVKTKTQDILRKFFKESAIWKQSVTVPMVAAQSGYVATPPAGAGVGRLLSIEIASTGVPLRETAELAMNSVSRTWRVESSYEPSRYIPDIEPARFAVWPIPNQAIDGLRVRMALYPTSSATSVQDWVMDEYREEIVSGVVGALQRLPRKPWTDLKEAGRNDDILAGAISKARVASAKDGARGPTFARTMGFDEL